MNQNLLEKLRPLSVEQRLRLFVEWLATQPRETPYAFSETTGCAMCQFAKAHGYANGYSVGMVSAGGAHVTFHKADWSEEVIQLLPVAFGSDFKFNPTGPAVFAIVSARTLGELYDNLAPLVGHESGILTDEALDALELRPLVPFGKETAK